MQASMEDLHEMSLEKKYLQDIPSWFVFINPQFTLTFSFFPLVRVYMHQLWSSFNCRYFFPFSPTEKYLHHSLFNLISRDLFWLVKVYFDQLSFIFDSLTYPDESIFVLTSWHLHWTDKICFYQLRIILIRRWDAFSRFIMASLDSLIAELNGNLHIT